MEEHLAACENHLQVRTKEAESLNKQVKALNEKVSELRCAISVLFFLTNFSQRILMSSTPQCSTVTYLPTSRSLPLSVHVGCSY